ncbi:hypothetical protein F5B20DRAFT_429721 [Whalleya microplaca]|nr:hypothetical protein F5B20DRAFT_429721 [Whalleya microplaca]
MSLSKQRISSPLEAGPSILDAYNLPSHLTGALEYASKRLARKSLHITLVVVRKEYQLPTILPPSPASPPPSENRSAFTSPTRFASPVAGLRQLVRRGTNNSSISLKSSKTASSDKTNRSSASYPTYPPSRTDGISSPRRWALPTSPRSPMPCTPMTPQTPASTVTTSSASSLTTQGPNEFGLRLIYTGLLSPKAEKTLRTTIAKAEKKFRIGTGWLPPATPASAVGLNADLIRRSILQNEVLFSAEGLTLLGLDRLYTFKAALAAYARAAYALPTLTMVSSSQRIEDAVDSLRRLVLANSGRPVSRGDLHRSYDWLGVHPRALRDVERMYRRAYGGPGRSGAFEPSPEEREREGSYGSIRPVPVQISTLPSSSQTQKAHATPVLKLDTKLAMSAAGGPQLVRPKPKPVAGKGEVVEMQINFDGLTVETEDSSDEDGDRTARPVAQGASSFVFPWNSSGGGAGQGGGGGAPGGASIDEMMLSPCELRQSQHLGPMTPNGYEDISPVTRSEWGFLFKNDGWTQAGRTAAVETC